MPQSVDFDPMRKNLYKSVVWQYDGPMARFALITDEEKILSQVEPVISEEGLGKEG
jgi:hypothetical protein